MNKEIFIRPNGYAISPDDCNTMSNAVSSGAYDTYASAARVLKVEKDLEKLLAEPEVRRDQRTALNTTGKRIEAVYYKDGFKTGSKDLIANIEKVEVYNENTVKITFANGDVQTATAQNGDEFSFETGAMICLMKQMIGKEASQILGKLVDYTAKIFNDAEKAKEKAAQEETERLAAQKRHKERMDRRWAKKRAQEKEARIQEMTEAIVRANGLLKIKK